MGTLGDWGVEGRSKQRKHAKESATGMRREAFGHSRCNCGPHDNDSGQ